MTEGNAGNAPTNRVQAAQEPLTILLLDAQPLQLEPLTADAFKPFGDVIEATQSAKHFTINQGFAERFDRLAHVDVSQEGGTKIERTLIGLERLVVGLFTNFGSIRNCSADLHRGLLLIGTSFDPWSTRKTSPPTIRP